MCIRDSTFPVQATEILGREANASGFNFGAMPEDLKGTVDSILFIRALHNLNRSGDEYFGAALTDAMNILKPGGVLGVVQHRAPEGAADASAIGERGYLKQSHVIAVMENAGFVFEEASEINANPNDVPGDEDAVWRLPPTLGMGDKDRDTFIAIGESDRMTLRFRKPE